MLLQRRWLLDPLCKVGENLKPRYEQGAVTWPNVFTMLGRFRPDKSKLIEPKDAIEAQDWTGRPWEEAFPYLTSDDVQMLAHENGTLTVIYNPIRIRRDNEYVSWDDIISQDYWKEVRELHFSPAGKKAMELLKEVLDEKQIKDLEEKGQFSFPHIERQEDGTLRKHSFQFQVWPHFGAFQLLLVKGKATWVSFCWHPEEPIPPADLALIFILKIQSDGYRSLLNEANW